MLIEQAEALGEPLEDPLLLFSVLYGFCLANILAFNGDVACELAAQFLALAEKQRATIPLMVGHRLVGTSLLCTGESWTAERISIRRSRFTIPRASFAGDPVRSRHPSVRSCHCGRSPCGCLAIPKPHWPTWMKRSMNAREIGHAPSLMYALIHHFMTHLSARKICGSKRAS